MLFIFLTPGHSIPAETGTEREGEDATSPKGFSSFHIAHHGLRATASAIDRVLLLLEKSSDQFADNVPCGRLLNGNHGTMPLFLPTLDPAFRR